MNDVIRVVIADDDNLFLMLVANSLKAEPGVEVVGQGASAEQAVQLVRDLAPDVVVLDIGMPGGGLSSARTITADYPATRVMMLTSSQDEDDIEEAFKAGASAYVLKGVTQRELVRIIRAARAGECYLSPSLPAGPRVRGRAIAPETLGAS